ncbi:MAG: type II toxin-antitoxin system VapC family toxin [Gaiella sp.]
MKLLDTSIAVDVLRGRTEAVELVTRLVVSDDIVASELTRFELLAGARPKELDDLEAFCSALRWLPVDSDVARTAGALARRYRKAFSGIDDIDYLIAASALVVDADLLTTNVRHYPMLKGLAAPY